MPPAILKGWIDRVLRMEIAYRFVANDKGEGVPVGLLKARAAIVFNTANTPEDRERETFGDPLESLWKKCVFDLCGVKEFIAGRFRSSSPARRSNAPHGCGKFAKTVTCALSHRYAANYRNFMSTAFQIVVCGGIVPDPLQTLEPVAGANRPGAEK